MLVGILNLLSLFKIYISLWSYLFVSNRKDFEKKKLKMWREKRNNKVSPKLGTRVHRKMYLLIRGFEFFVPGCAKHDRGES